MLKKEKIAFFDFFKEKVSLDKEKKEKKRKLISNFNKYFYLFLASQLTFFSVDYFYSKQYIQTQALQLDTSLSEYEMLKDSVKTGDNQKAMHHFSSLLYNNDGTDGLLIGIYLLMLKNSELSNNLEYKIDSKTLETMLDMYNQNYNKKILEKIETTKNYQCFALSGICHLLKFKYQNDILHTQKYLKNKIEANHYNVNHIEQYHEWNNKIQQKIENKEELSEQDRMSPGAKYVENLNK